MDRREMPTARLAPVGTKARVVADYLENDFPPASKPEEPAVALWRYVSSAQVGSLVRLDIQATCRRLR
jgi:hypothetical protein